MSAWMPANWPDFKALESAGEIIGHTNKAAKWLQAHREDPYWYAHKICEHKWNWDDFSIRWKEARFLKM